MLRNLFFLYVFFVRHHRRVLGFPVLGELLPRLEFHPRCPYGIFLAAVMQPALPRLATAFLFADPPYFIADELYYGMGHQKPEFDHADLDDRLRAMVAQVPWILCYNDH